MTRRTGRRRGRAVRYARAGLLLALWSSRPTKASAHSAGMATESCSCHFGGSVPTVLLTPDLTQVNPGQSLNLSVSVSATNGQSAGFFLEASTGTFNIVDAGTKLAGNGVTHSATRTSASGTITFRVGWTAPATPGGVDFHVWANSANGHRDSAGDGEGTAFYSLAFGCAGRKFYLDGDADGIGSESSGYTVACRQPAHYSTEAGDCADNDPRIFPGNREVCDGRDNDCDGQADEGLELVTLCTDSDGDGHGVLGKATVVGCTSDKGFGLCDNDCDDSDPRRFPGAQELCNGKDDNCNQQVDENARPSCGVGWCRNVSPDCTTPCVPRLPQLEVCNNFDDDCDGVNDNGTDAQLCGAAGLVCSAGACVAVNTGPTQSAGTTSAGGSVGDPPLLLGGAPAGEAPEPPPSPSVGCSFAQRVLPSPLAAGALLAFAALFFRRRAASASALRPPLNDSN